MILLDQPTGLQNGQAIVYTGDSVVGPRTGTKLTVRPIVRGGHDTLDSHHQSPSGREFVWVRDAQGMEWLVQRTEIEAA